MRMLGILIFHLLAFPFQILYCQYRPTWYFADVCPDSRDITQQEDGGQEEREPDDVAIHLLDCHKHHGVEVTATHKLPEVEMREVEVGERQLATVVHHVFIKEMREDGGVETISHRTAEIHVNDVEYK